MRLERPSLWLQPGPLAFRFDVSRKLAGVINPRDDLKPHDANQPPAFEGPELAELELESRKWQLAEPVGDLVDHGALDIAYKADGEVQVCSGRPAKLRRHRRASCKVGLQECALRFGHRKPEERAHLQRRAGFFQFAGTQLLGAVGRQPKCVLTESMPSAMLSS